ncbi:MAG: hypothetical protein HQK60_15875, partial [Deltaproteobacteria bacterium]|nr:hypothetical protein [Deltaproteobacteria bacterium]
NLVYHGMSTFQSPDVMRFLGRNIPPDGRLPHAFAGEVVSDLKKRPEGIRIKHRVKENSIKLYDKQGSVLRTETTINNPYGFKVYRPKDSEKDAKPQWQPMRKGIADLHRLTQVSQSANNRYLNALAATENTSPLSKWTKKLCRQVSWKKKTARAINPFSPVDFELLKTVSRGEFSIAGFRNQDLRTYLYKGDDETSSEERRRRSAAVTRKIRLLRAHGLVTKVPHSHRYLLTKKGRIITTAFITAHQADINMLTKLAC